MAGVAGGCRKHSWPREDDLDLGWIVQHLLGQALDNPPIDMTTSLPVGSCSGPQPRPPDPEPTDLGPPHPVLVLHFQDTTQGEAAPAGQAAASLTVPTLPLRVLTETAGSATQGPWAPSVALRSFDFFIQKVGMCTFCLRHHCGESERCYTQAGIPRLLALETIQRRWQR